MPKIPRRIKSIPVIYVLAMVAFFGVHLLFTPDTFGKYGHYWAKAIDEIAALEIAWDYSRICTA